MKKNNFIDFQHIPKLSIGFNPSSSITLENHVCLGVQSHPEHQGDLGQGSTVNISECNNQLELICVALTW